MSSRAGSKYSPFLVLLVMSGLQTARADCSPQDDATAFMTCLVCHTAAADAGHMSGPNLWGILGRAAGSAAGYTYSGAIRDSGIVWDAENLRRYLADPSGYLPGTRMIMAPIRDDAELDAVICHLATLKD